MIATYDMLPDAFAVFELSGERFEPDAFVGLVHLQGHRPARRGDPMGPRSRGRTAVRGIQLFSVAGSEKLTMSETCRRLLDGVRRHAADISRLAEEQGLDWGILIFEGDVPEEGLAGVERAVLEDAAVLGVPIRQKFGL